jgi:hypothetical protein
MAKWVPEMAILAEGAVEGKNQEVKNYGSYFNETVTGSRRPFRTPDEKMEP